MTGSTPAGTFHPPDGGRRFSRHFGPCAVALAGGLLIALTWLGVQEAVQTHRTEVRAHIEAVAADAAFAAEEQFRVQLLAIDQTLRIVQSEWQRDPDGFKIADWQQDIPVLTGAALQVFMTDQHGIIRASTHPQLIGRDAGDRDDFRRAAALPAGDDHMLVGSLVHALAGPQWQIDLTRRLQRPDGSFAGVIVAAYDPRQLAQVYGRFGFGSRRLVALVDVRNGAVDALASPQAAEPGGSIAGSRLFAAIAAEPAGVWTGVSPLDRVERVHAFHQVPGRHLAVVVAAGRAAAMQGVEAWDRGAQTFGAGISVLVLLLGGLLVLSTRAAQRREAVLAHDRAMLGEKTRQLEATLGGMSDGIMMLDAELRVTAWNDKFSACTGVPRDLLRIGLPMAEMLHAQALAGEFGPVEPEAEVARRMELLRTGFGIATMERVRPNGKVIELRRNPLPGGGFVTLYTDITDRRAAEERMREAQKMAALGRLTAGVAHDFNNVLASIMGSAELLERYLRDVPAHARRLAVILQGAQRGADLVRQLLAFSRKQPLAPVAVDPNHIVRGMSELLGSTLGGAVRVGTRFGARWPALVDPVQIEHVILNLAINARDAMPEGGTLTIATADVTLERRLDSAGLAPGDYVAVSVADTGTGMTPEVLRNALEPFFTTKPPGRGSGLGLSQVYGVASQSGGGVQIDSVVGSGTTVTVFLPRAAAVPERGGASPRPVPAAETIPGQGTVLLVEDEPDVRETIAGMLSAIGFAALVAEDGAAALRLLDAGHGFDLLLADLVMPGVNGMQLAAAVRARRPGVPVVLITGYNDDLRITGERWVLTKPFVGSRLAETLRAALWHAGITAARPETVA